MKTKYTCDNCGTLNIVDLSTLLTGRGNGLGHGDLMSTEIGLGGLHSSSDFSNLISSNGFMNRLKNIKHNCSKCKKTTIINI